MRKIRITRNGYRQLAMIGTVVRVYIITLASLAIVREITATLTAQAVIFAGSFIGLWFLGAIIAEVIKAEYELVDDKEARV
jgi:hypothetical protein